MFKTILVAVDGSPNSDRAIRAAAEMAAAHGSRLHICHVSHVPEHYAAHISEVMRESIRSDGEEILAHAERVAGEFNVEVSKKLVDGDHPAETIIDTAQKIGAGLIVTGVRGRTPDMGRSMGSVSVAIAMQARCSVMLVRH